MRAPLVVPALLLLDAIVVARDLPHRDALVLAAIAAAAALAGESQASLVAACAVSLGLTLGAWRVAPVQITAAVPSVLLQGTVAGDLGSSSFELRASDGRRYAVALRERAAMGERLRLSGRLEPFDAPRNPGEPSDRAFARERGLCARLAQARILARAPPDLRDLATFAPRLRAAADERLRRLLGEPDATILAGMLYGARGALPAELRAEFQDTGTVHVLVTAGLHLGVVAALVAFLFARLGVGRVAGSLGAIPLVWSYAVFSGAHVPSLRAATMVTIALFARALGERALSLNTLALAAIVVAAVWPAWVGGASFGLSFSCVAAIVLFAEPIGAGLERLRVPPAFREALALTLSTQLGVWPLTAATFLVIAPYAALANLFVVPVVGIALVGGLALLAVAPFPALAAPLAHIEAWPLAWIESAVHLTAGLPYAHVVATPPPAWTIAVYDLASIAAAALLRLRCPSA
jgi:competence protein ComEC